MSPSSPYSHWQQAWDEAEPRIREWTNSWNIPSVGGRVLRVGQLDAELLDEELAQTLQEPLVKALGTLNAALRTKFEPELALIIRLILYKLSVWNLGATYGAKLQDLRYVCSTSSNGPLSPSGLPKRILTVHACLTILVPYLHNRLRSHALSHAWPDAPSVDRRRKAWDLLSKLESYHSAAALLSFVVFLWNGRYRTLADRLLSLHLVPSRRLANRQVSYEFMNRQMVWHAFTEFLLLVLPIFSSRAFRRTSKQIKTRVRNFSWATLFPRSLSTASEGKSRTSARRGRYFALSEDQCAICVDKASFGLSSRPKGESANFSSYLDASATEMATRSTADGETISEEGPPQHPLTTPYTASCGHVYCYFCLSERLIRAIDDGDDGWECLRCEELIHNCERVAALSEDNSSSTSDGWDSSEETTSLGSSYTMDSMDSSPEPV